MDTFGATYIHRLVSYSIIPLLALILLYQKKHYGLKFYDHFFIWFYIIYCFYIFLYITILRRYPLDTLMSVPKSEFLYVYEFLISICYLLCAPTIYHHFSVRKFVFLSFMACTIPSILFIHYIGVDLIQSNLDEEAERYLQTLTVTFSNVPILVLAVVFYKKLFRWKWLSIIVSTTIIAAVVYVLFIFGKRGPLLWSIVNVIICYLIVSVNMKKYFLLLGIVCMSFYIFMDPILEGISEVLPRTGKQIELSMKEGNTSLRFDLNDPKHSNYLIGLEHFSRSPIWGYYFRHVTDDRNFRGVYAHNIFVEILMTMGLMGFIPFMMLLIKALSKSRKTFIQKYSNNQMAFFVLFMCQFLQLQTTGSIVSNHNFWLFFYLLCCIDILSRKSNLDIINRIDRSLEDRSVSMEKL